jgi:hypothetical protein
MFVCMLVVGRSSQFGGESMLVARSCLSAGGWGGRSSQSLVCRLGGRGLPLGGESEFAAWITACDCGFDVISAPGWGGRGSHSPACRQAGLISPLGGGSKFTPWITAHSCRLEVIDFGAGVWWSGLAFACL